MRYQEDFRNGKHLQIWRELQEKYPTVDSIVDTEDLVPYSICLQFLRRKPESIELLYRALALGQDLDFVVPLLVRTSFADVRFQGVLDVLAANPLHTMTPDYWCSAKAILCFRGSCWEEASMFVRRIRDSEVRDETILQLITLIAPWKGERLLDQLTRMLSSKGPEHKVNYAMAEYYLNRANGSSAELYLLKNRHRSVEEDGRFFDWGQLKFNLGLNIEALSFYREALIRSPENPSLIAASALAHLFMNEYAQAKSSLERAKAIDPYDKWVLRADGVYHMVRWNWPRGLIILYKNFKRMRRAKRYYRSVARQSMGE